MLDDIDGGIFSGLFPRATNGRNRRVCRRESYTCPYGGVPLKGIGGGRAGSEFFETIQVQTTLVKRFKYYSETLLQLRRAHTLKQHNNE